jgi:hypothetical protein
MEEVMNKRSTLRALITLSLLSLSLFTTGPTAALQSKAGMTTPRSQEQAMKKPVEATTIQDLAEFITYERLCCPFFDLEIVVEREGGPAWLRLRGREGVKEFIRIEFGIQ